MDRFMAFIFFTKLIIKIEFRIFCKKQNYQLILIKVNYYKKGQMWES
jgi:hypothetical protein